MSNVSKNHSRTKNILIYPIYQRLFFLPTIFSLINFKFLAIFSIILAISFIAFYTFQIANVISQGHQIQNYQKKISALLEENKNLELSVAKINSLEEINDKMQELGFEKMTKIYYIQVLESSVAATQNKIE